MNAARPENPLSNTHHVIFTCYFQVDSRTDFLDNDEGGHGDRTEESGTKVPRAGPDAPAPARTPPVKQKRHTATSRGKSLEILDDCLPKEPRIILISSPALHSSVSLWLQRALFAGGEELPDSVGASRVQLAMLPLTARLLPLAQRMQRLLLKAVYARGRADNATGSGSGWADGGRPAGFVGAGLAEELCLAVFGRIQGLRAQGVGKQVGDWWLAAVIVAKYL